MAAPSTNLRVRISADMADIKQGLGLLRGELAKVKSDSAKAVDVRPALSGLRNVRRELAGLFAGVSFGFLIREMIKSTAEAAAAVAQLDARLKSTQGAAGLARGELIEMANALQKVTTFSDEAVINAQALLLSFTRVGRDVFPQAIEAALNLSTGLGQDLQSSVVSLGKALNDPIKGITALGRAGVQFTSSQKEMIKSLVEAGDLTKAQTIILKELETQFGGSARAARDTFGGAIEGAKNAVGELLEGDSGSDGVRGAVTSINNLTATLSDPQVKEGFNNLVSGVASVTAELLEGIGMMASYIARMKDVLNLNRKVQAGQKLTDYGETNARIAQIVARQKQLASPAGRGGSDLATFGGEDKGFLAFRLQNKDAYSRNAELAYLLKERQAMVRANTKAIQAEAAEGLKSDLAAAAGAETAAAAAKAAAAAEAAAAGRNKGGQGGSNPAADRLKEIRAEAERLRKESEAGAEKITQELMARDERIDKGLQDARIAELNLLGRTAEASFLQIDEKWARTLADLIATGNEAGLELVRKVINLEKFDAQMSELRARAADITAGLQSAETAISAQASAGLLGQVESEKQLQEVRQQALIKLRELRQAALDFYNAQAPGTPAHAAALAGLQQLDTSIATVMNSQDTFRQQAEDLGTGALSTFFTDLASGAKSFKDSFADLVRSFVAGIAQMIAQQLALNAVRAIGGFGGGTTVGVAHGGGIAGAFTQFRSNVSPLIFGTAPRYHGGGVAGLRPGEVPAILEEGERIRTQEQEAALQQKLRFGQGGGSGRVTTPVVVFGEAALADALAGRAGEQMVVTHVRNNRRSID